MNVFISQILYAQFCNVIQKVANTKMCPQGLLYRISKKWKKYIKKKKRISETLSIAINHNLWRQYKDWTFVALHRRGIYVLLYLNVSSYSVTLLRFLFCFFFFSLSCVWKALFSSSAGSKSGLAVFYRVASVPKSRNMGLDQGNIQRTQSNKMNSGVNAGKIQRM